MIRLLALFMLGSTLFWSCGSGNNTSETDNTDSPTTQNEVASQAPATATLPAFPKDSILVLFDQCDYIDFVFYNGNFSISQNEQASIRSSLGHISPEAAPMQPECKPMGRIFYQINGENRAQADFYFSQNCLYYIFMEDNKPKYANKMTEQGFNFFKNIFTQIQQSQQAQ